MAFNPGIIATPLDTRYPDEIVADALATLQARRPEWVARNASPEVVFLEALAVSAAEVMDTGDAVIGALAEGVLSTLYGIPRLPGAPAVGEITLTFDTTVTTTIPAGTRFLLADYDTEVVTTAAVTVNAATTAVLQVASATATSALNGVTTATVDLLDAIPNALLATVTSGFANGADPEGDQSYLDRAGQALNRVTNSLVVPTHFEAYARQSGVATNALCIAAWAGGDVNDIGSDGGSVTVCVYGRGGQVSADARAALAAEMQDITAAGITVYVNEVALHTVDVTMTVKANPGYAAADVQAAVEAAVAAYLNAETWPIGEALVPGALDDVVTTLPEVDYIDTRSAPSGSSPVVIDPDAVAVANTVTISVI